MAYVAYSDLCINSYHLAHSYAFANDHLSFEITTARLGIYAMLDLTDLQFFNNFLVSFLKISKIANGIFLSKISFLSKKNIFTKLWSDN